MRDGADESSGRSSHDTAIDRPDNAICGDVATSTSRLAVVWTSKMWPSVVDNAKSICSRFPFGSS
jgi:hypothetical protein